MRRTGKTTRLVNSAVEMLFTNGKITFLTNRQIFDRGEEWKLGLRKHEIEMRETFIDYDAHKDNNAQREFIERFERRISIENNSQITRRGNTYFANKKLK